MVVNEQMQVPNYPNIMAIGDLIQGVRKTSIQMFHVYKRTLLTPPSFQAQPDA